MNESEIEGVADEEYTALYLNDGTFTVLFQDGIGAGKRAVFWVKGPPGPSPPSGDDEYIIIVETVG